MPGLWGALSASVVSLTGRVCPSFGLPNRPIPATIPLRLRCDDSSALTPVDTSSPRQRSVAHFRPASLDGLATFWSSIPLGSKLSIEAHTEVQGLLALEREWNNLPRRNNKVDTIFLTWQWQKEKRGNVCQISVLKKKANRHDPPDGSTMRPPSWRVLTLF